MLKHLLWIGLGAASGAWLRYGLTLLLNPLFPSLPLGTLAVNLTGGYLIGLLIPLSVHQQGLSPELQLALMTGFLGALTTFSTFSAETVSLLLKQNYAWAIAHVAAHSAGSVGMTLLGIATCRKVWL